MNKPFMPLAFVAAFGTLALLALLAAVTEVKAEVPAPALSESRAAIADIRAGCATLPILWREQAGWETLMQLSRDRLTASQLADAEERSRQIREQLSIKEKLCREFEEILAAG